MVIVIDLILAAIFVLAVVLGVRKGFARAAVEVAGIILAFVIAFSASLPLSEWIYDTSVERKLTASVSQGIDDQVDETAGQRIDGFFQDNPMLATFASFAGVTAQSVKSGLSESAGIDAVKSYVCDKVVRPAAVLLIRTVLIIVMLLVLLILVKVIAVLVGKLFSVPVIGTFNSVLGGLLGACKGLLYVFAAGLLFTFLISLFPNGIAGFTAESVKDTVLLRAIVKIAGWQL